MSVERLDQIKNVLSMSPVPMSCDEIAAKLDLIRPFGPMPWNSIQTEIELALSEGAADILATHPGVYVMRANAKVAHLRNAQLLQAQHRSEQLGLITCYGEGWHRDKVDWERVPLQIIGRQMMNSTPINVANQTGFYVLGWGPGKPVEFIGFSGERSIGECLLEHTTGRVSGRWTHFSYYGLRPVLIDGSFGPLPESVTLAEAATSMFSVLVDVVQPKTNPRYYDTFSTLEFSQR